MNEELLRHARSRNKSKFKTAWKAINGTEDGWEIGYNALVAQLRGGSSPSGGSTGFNGAISTDGDTKGAGEILGKIKDTFNNVTGSIAGVIQELYESQIGQGTNTGNSADTVLKLLEIVKRDGVLSLDTLKDSISLIKNEIIDQLTQEAELRSYINEETTLTGELSEKLRQDMLESSISAAKYGYTVKDLGELYVKLVNDTGRFSMLNKKTLDESAPIVRSFVGSFEKMATIISDFEKVGIGANKTLKTIEEVGVRSMGLGLNGRKVTEEVGKNIARINEYGFQNGIKGLESMVRKSLEFRMGMEETFKIAERVMNPEGALELVANLQVLGGAFGDFNDPIRMMYDATNNVEGLQDSLIGAAKSLATYNQEQGRFEITGVNLRRAHEMAKQLGIDYNELAKGAIAAAERSSALASIASTGLKMDDKDREFLMNMSRMEGGEMKIVIPEALAQKLNKPAEIALDKLDQNTADALIDYRKRMESMNAKDIAMEQLTETEKMSRDVSVIATYLKVRAAQTIRGIAGGTRLQELYGDLRQMVNTKAQDTINSTDYNFDKKVEQGIKNFKLSEPIQSFKEGFDKPIEKEKPEPKTSKPTASLTKEEMSDAFYAALNRWDNGTRKKDGTNISIQTVNEGSYFSNQSIG